MTNPGNAHAPTKRGAAVGFGESRQPNHTDIKPDVENLLRKLERVRKFGKGWSARCPAHTDKSASLSVGLGDNGLVLVHCFAGCPVADVLGAIGLSTSDLFPKRLKDMTPEGRRAAREGVRMAEWRAALGVLALEASIIAIAAGDILRRRLRDEDMVRVFDAAERIDAARQVLQ